MSYYLQPVAKSLPLRCQKCNAIQASDGRFLPSHCYRCGSKKLVR